MPTYISSGNIYGVDTGDNRDSAYDDGTKILVLDPDTYEMVDDTLSATIDLPDRTIAGLYGIAYNPVDKKFYILVEYDEFDSYNKFLGTVDVSTGVITEIGPVGDLQALFFTPNGALYGINDSSGGLEGGIYFINRKTLGKKFVLSMSDHDPNGVVFNPTDGFLYHWNVPDQKIVMTRINLSTKEIFAVPTTGDTVDADDVLGAVYLSDNTFLVFHDGTGSVSKVTTNGVMTNLDIEYDGPFSGLAQAYTYKSTSTQTNPITGVKCIKFGSKRVVTSGSCRN